MEGRQQREAGLVQVELAEGIATKLQQEAQRAAETISCTRDENQTLQRRLDEMQQQRQADLEQAAAAAAALENRPVPPSRAEIFFTEENCGAMDDFEEVETILAQGSAMAQRCKELETEAVQARDANTNLNSALEAVRIESQTLREHGNTATQKIAQQEVHVLDLTSQFANAVSLLASSNAEMEQVDKSLAVLLESAGMTPVLDSCSQEGASRRSLLTDVANVVAQLAERLAAAAADLASARDLAQSGATRISQLEADTASTSCKLDAALATLETSERSSEQKEKYTKEQRVRIEELLQ
jgi:hypothetical protein